MKAGTDIDCGNVMSQSAVDRAIRDGFVSSDLIDERLANLLRIQFRLGFYNSPDTLPDWIKLTPANAVDTPAHRKLALDAAEQAAVLLKNAELSAANPAAQSARASRPTLPLDIEKLESIAVIGPLADATTALQGNYFGSPPYLVSPLDGIQNYTASHRPSLKVVFARGCDIDSNTSDSKNFSAAVAAAATADAVVLVVGADQLRGGEEGTDRTDISLPAPQDQLVLQVSAAAMADGNSPQKPVVVVVISGESVDLNAVASNRAVGAILWQGYPSQSGGTALARLLFGAANPSGRLPITFYKAGYTTAVSMYDMAMRPNKTNGNPGRTYRFYSGPDVLFPFGTGLSYTSFSYTNCSTSVAEGLPTTSSRDRGGASEMLRLGRGRVARGLRHSRWTEQVAVTETITVTNTGAVAGHDQRS